MCIRDRYQRRVHGTHIYVGSESKSTLCATRYLDDIFLLFVYKHEYDNIGVCVYVLEQYITQRYVTVMNVHWIAKIFSAMREISGSCLLYTSPSPRDGLLSRMPSSA
eukprot:TRINITY_DN3129_c0_g1_i2.p3 TRINITY_DN3129_c0_g1~~TRINITY_DN3129_c0_g1_i2.p3  ORF type:complete len:107 (+),score=15.02 TRINITY_DN3129_c0_g1_i2:66-386(+)